MSLSTVLHRGLWFVAVACAACRASEPPGSAKSLPTARFQGQNVEVLAASNAQSVRDRGGELLQGAGVRVGDWDDGHALDSHVDLRGRVLVRDGAGLSEHATHTTATIAGSGSGQEQARGFAPAARVWSYDWLYDLAEAEEAAPALDLSSHPYLLSMGWGAQSGCPQRPSWWGGPARQDAAFGKYGREAAAIDALVFRTALFMVWPAGNQRLDVGVAAGEPHLHYGSCSELYTDGHLQEATLQYDTLGGQALAKNALTVAAARDVPGGAGGARIVPLDISAFGPPDDGRIKPDVAFAGEAVRSASLAADDAYGTFSGTSSATAAAAGAAALLSEAYRREHGADLPAEGLRALMVHSARDAGRDPGPDYRLGFGLVDVAAAAEVIAADGAGGAAAARSILVGAIGQEPITLRTATDVPAGSGLRVTLAWTDPPADVNRGGVDDRKSTLVNDLDVSMIAPDGETRYRPWSLDPDEPAAAARSDAPNRRDNLEVIDVAPEANTASGRWSVLLEANGSLSRGRAQGFVLVSSRPLLPPPAGQPVLELPRRVEVAFDLGEAPEPVVLKVGRAGEAVAWRASSPSARVAVTPDSGQAGDELTIVVDPAAYASPGLYLERILMAVDDARGERVLGVVVDVRCEPECAQGGCGADPRCGALCGRCALGEACSDGRCEAWAPGCPAADLGAVLGSAVVTGELALAGSSREEGSCGGDDAPEAGFVWRAPHDGRYWFSTRGSSADTVLYLRDGACAGAELACSDDSGDATSAVSARLAAGDEVAVLVDAHDAAQRDPFVLNVQRARCPDADLGSRLGEGLVRATTFGGVDDLAGACGGAGAEDAVFGWTAPADGAYSFSLFDPRFQAVLYVLEDTCDGVELACSAAADVGPIELALMAGERVMLVVDGREGTFGDFQLDVRSLEASSSCEGSCGVAAPSGLCHCGDDCVARGDCCIDACQACGQCRCVRDCAGRRCGPDGCGGSCGPCAGDQRCDAGRCVPDACAGVTCDPCERCVAGECEALAEGAACEDGDLCTVLDRCSGGRCRGEARDCDDGIACTRDVCRGGGSCESLVTDDCGRCDGGADCPLRLPDAAPGGDDAGAMPRASSDAGCGCRLAGGHAAPSGLALALAALVGVVRRRRRRRTSARDERGRAR